MKNKIEKFKVCKDCLSIGITDSNCVCTYQNGYKTVELEFEICGCCGEVSFEPIDNFFNYQQLGGEENEEEFNKAVDENDGPNKVEVPNPTDDFLIRIAEMGRINDINEDKIHTFSENILELFEEFQIKYENYGKE